jgi:hypothetical protein
MPGGRWQAQFVASNASQQAYALDRIEQRTAALAQ